MRGPGPLLGRASVSGLVDKALGDVHLGFWKRLLFSRGSSQRWLSFWLEVIPGMMASAISCQGQPEDKARTPGTQEERILVAGRNCPTSEFAIRDLPCRGTSHVSQPSPHRLSLLRRWLLYPAEQVSWTPCCSERRSPTRPVAAAGVRLRPGLFDEVLGDLCTHSSLGRLP